MAIDLTNCDKEPIHLVNAIQEKGHFIRLRYFDLEVLGVSRNLLTNGNIPSLDQLFEVVTQFTDWLRDGEQDHVFISQYLKTKEYEVALIKSVVSDEEIHIEFEKTNGEYPSLKEVEIGVEISRTEGLKDLGDLIVKKVHELTGFERIMLYRFDEEFNGEVVNEHLSPNSPLTSYLDHRFPASDIPSQARAMLEKKTTRLIQDVNFNSVNIINKKGSSLVDMTFSEYRYPSEIHLEYLRNMKVTTTFTISLLYKKRLWGLVACHHSSQHDVNPWLRNLCYQIGQMASRRIRSIIDNETKKGQKELNDVLSYLKVVKLSNERKLGLNACLKIMKHFKADNYFYYSQGKLIEQSEKTRVLPEFHDWVNLQSALGIFYSNAIYIYLSEDVLPDIAGAMVIPLGQTQKLVLTRSVHPKIIKWAGNPDKAVSRLDQTGKINPRKSFETWVSVKKKLSESWEYHLIETSKNITETAV